MITAYIFSNMVLLFKPIDFLSKLQSCRLIKIWLPRKLFFHFRFPKKDSITTFSIGSLLRLEPAEGRQVWCCLGTWLCILHNILTEANQLFTSFEIDKNQLILCSDLKNSCPCWIVFKIVYHKNIFYRAKSSTEIRHEKLKQTYDKNFSKRPSILWQYIHLAHQILTQSQHYFFILSSERSEESKAIFLFLSLFPVINDGQLRTRCVEVSVCPKIDCLLETLLS